MGMLLRMDLEVWLHPKVSYGQNRKNHFRAESKNLILSR